MHVWMFCEIIDTPIASEWFAVRMHTITSHTFSFDVNHKHISSTHTHSLDEIRYSIRTTPILGQYACCCPACRRQKPSTYPAICLDFAFDENLPHNLEHRLYHVISLVPSSYHHPTYAHTITLTSLSLWACRIFSSTVHHWKMLLLVPMTASFESHINYECRVQLKFITWHRNSVENIDATNDLLGPAKSDGKSI